VLAGQTLNACHTPCSFDAAYSSVGIAWLVGIEVLLSMLFVVRIGLRIVWEYRNEEPAPAKEQLDQIRCELVEIRARLGEG
jgi:hypothetical protein